MPNDRWRKQQQTRPHSAAIRSIYVGSNVSGNTGYFPTSPSSGFDCNSNPTGTPCVYAQMNGFNFSGGDSVAVDFPPDAPAGVAFDHRHYLFGETGACDRKANSKCHSAQICQLCHHSCSGVLNRSYRHRPIAGTDSDHTSDPIRCVESQNGRKEPESMRRAIS